MKAYKGFDKDLKCREFQYEIGKEYEEENASLCDCGFHACEAPLDVFNYYSPTDSRFCEVELDEVSDEKSDDSKRVGKKIKIGAEIGIPGLAKAHVEWVKEQIEKCKCDNKAATNTGYKSAATNAGDYSAATNTGDYSAATNTGNMSAATNTGYKSAATNTGYKSAATNTGNMSAATNTGYKSAATNTGDYSAATNTGDYSAATVSGSNGVATAIGLSSKVKAAVGCGIVCTERGEWDGKGYPLIGIKAAIVDGEIIKPDTWYALKDGEFVEVEDEV